MRTKKLSAKEYVCPTHTATGGYENCCDCGGWKKNEKPRYCDEYLKSKHTKKRAKKITALQYGSPLYLRSIKKQIKELVDRESFIDFCKTPDTHELPTLEPVEPLKKSVGLWNFYKTSVLYVFLHP